jgi:hypothetical protein
MVLTNSAVSAFVRDQPLLTSAHDAQALEEILIVMPELEVTFNSDKTTFTHFKRRCGQHVFEVVIVEATASLQ